MAKKSSVKNKGKTERMFIFALIFLGVAFLFFILNVSDYFGLTGKVTGTGTANLTISTSTSINFSTSNISWGPGSVDEGQTIAILDTSAGTVTNGNWTDPGTGLIVENLGNQNVTLELATGKNADSFIGGSDGSALTDGAYRFNVSSVELGSCTNNTAGFGDKMLSGYNRSVFFNVNTTSPGTRVCDIFRYVDTNDTIRIDIYLNISSTSSVTGTVGDIITATATAI